MKTIEVTRVIFSTINNKWYLQLNNLHEVEISERYAKELISYYGLEEINLNRFELIN